MLKNWIYLGLFFFLLVRVSPVWAVSSSNYQLRDYGFGGGGFSGSSSNYKMEGISGETEYGKPESNNYGAGLGLNFVQQANVPGAPTVTNPANYYNQLHIVINTANNPSDTLYAIAVSSDNFASDIKYIQDTNTLGATLGIEDWQSYAVWGSGSGFDLIGLSPGTTYTFKVAAMQGEFTQTGFGPTAQAATINSTLTFDIDVASTDTETSAPFSVSLGSLTAATVTTASNKVWVDIDTNGTAGGLIYVYGTNNGLLSTSVSKTITSSSTNLTAATEGYGARSNSTAESAGGPIEAVSPYNGSSENVGVLDTTKRLIFDSSGAPVTAGRASFLIKAKASAVTEAASDYTDILTVVATAAF